MDPDEKIFTPFCFNPPTSALPSLLWDSQWTPPAPWHDRRHYSAHLCKNAPLSVFVESPVQGDMAVCLIVCHDGSRHIVELHITSITGSSAHHIPPPEAYPGRSAPYGASRYSPPFHPRTSGSAGYRHRLLSRLRPSFRLSPSPSDPGDRMSLPSIRRMYHVQHFTAIHLIFPVCSPIGRIPHIRC